MSNFSKYKGGDLDAAEARCRAILAAPETKPDHHVRAQRKLDAIAAERVSRKGKGKGNTGDPDAQAAPAAQAAE